MTVKATRIGVHPPEGLESRRRLLELVGSVFSVEFVTNAGTSFVAGWIIFGDGEPEGVSGPRLRLPAAHRDTDSPAQPVRFGTDRSVDSTLRGRSFVQETAPAIALEPADGDLVLASIGDLPVWLRRSWGGHEEWIAAYAVPEYDGAAPLRDRFRDGDFLTLLPLLDFARVIAAAAGWREPPLRAAILIDDPNLHSGSYGFLDFEDVADDADRHNYHVAIATIPIDAWHASPGVARFFQERARRLSLLIHGNNHVSRELASAADEGAATAMLAQALRRIERLERRSGVSVARIMAAPHGACAEDAMRSLARIGFEAICISRPYPWLKSAPGDRALAGFLPAELVAGGFPVLPRYVISADPAEIHFRAYLRQPIVLYGHHDDVAAGLDPFRAAAELVNGLGDVGWMSLDQISRSNFAERREGASLRIRLYGSRLDVPVPRGIDRVIPEVESIHGDSIVEAVRVDNARGDLLDEIPVRGGRDAHVRLEYDGRVEPHDVPPPPWRPWPIVRRALTEGRDRLRPVTGAR